MKYAIIICNNGNFSVDSEWGNLNSAKVSTHPMFWTPMS